MTSPRRFADPWPAPAVLWADPPWIMSGTSATAWFETAAAAVSTLLSPAFEPLTGTAGVPTRLRFYQVDYEPRDGDAAFRRRMAGSFREAVIAFRGRIAGYAGEYSAYMWTDREPYLCWGRENFGWPLVSGEIDLTGQLWGGLDVAGTRCRLRADGFACTLDLEGPTAEDMPGGPGPSWLTPRRILFPGGSEPERRDLLVVRPAVLAPGRLTRRAGRLRLDAPAGSWIASLAPLGGVDIHALEGFRICVGDDVSTVRGAGAPAAGPAPR
jgi:Acetoacetate decarboxylase (ADC)